MSNAIFRVFVVIGLFAVAVGLSLFTVNERELAINYLAHWQPNCSRTLFCQSLLVLDGLNAAIFGMICMERPFRLFARAGFSAVLERRQWNEFVRGLDTPQWLMPVQPEI